MQLDCIARASIGLSLRMLNYAQATLFTYIADYEISRADGAGCEVELRFEDDSDLRGMHRRVFHRLSGTSATRDDQLVVDALLVWRLPDSLYVDYEEVLAENLAVGAGAKGLFVHARSASVDSESIATDGRSYVGVEATGLPLHSSRWTLNITLPFHMRYHRAEQDVRFARLQVQPPRVLCSAPYARDPLDPFRAEGVFDVDHLGNAGNSQAHAKARATKYFDGVIATACEPLLYFMPVGSTRHSAAATYVTAIVYAATFLAVAVSLILLRLGAARAKEPRSDDSVTDSDE